MRRRDLVLTIFCLLSLPISGFTAVDDEVVPLINERGLVGKVVCHREADGSISGKMYSNSGGYAGFVRSFQRGDGKWWTEFYDYRGNLASSSYGVSGLFKNFFDKARPLSPSPVLQSSNPTEPESTQLGRTIGQMVLAASQGYVAGQRLAEQQENARRKQWLENQAYYEATKPKVVYSNVQHRQNFSAVDQDGNVVYGSVVEN